MQKNCQPSVMTADLRQYICHLYGGVFAGIVFMACVASCFGLATSISELAGFLFACLASSTLLYAASCCE